MDLKWLLVRRVTLVALGCLFVSSAFAIWQTNREAKRQNIELPHRVAFCRSASRAPASAFPIQNPAWDAAGASAAWA